MTLPAMATWPTDLEDSTVCESDASEGSQIPSLSKCSPLWFCHQCENGEPPAMVLISQKWPTMLEAAAARSHRLKCRVLQNVPWKQQQVD